MGSMLKVLVIVKLVALLTWLESTHADNPDRVKRSSSWSSDEYSIWSYSTSDDDSSSSSSSSSSSDSSSSDSSSSSSSSSSFGDHCKCDDDCGCNYYLVCVSRRCECHPSFVYVLGECIPCSCIGQECLTNEQCQENATCDAEHKTCRCMDGFLLNQDGKCVECSSVDFENYTLPCPEADFCEDCEDGLVRVNGNICSGTRVGEPCTDEQDTCIDNNAGCDGAVCACDDDFVWNGTHCVGSHLDDPCDHSPDSCAVNGLVCGPSGNCECPDDEVQQDNSCWSLLCNYCNHNDDCLGENMVCDNNICICMDGTYTDSCGVCQPKLPNNSTCTSDDQCISNLCVCDVCVPPGTEDCCASCEGFIGDFMLILDNSGSVGTFNYSVLKEFMKDLAAEFPITSTLNRFGVVDYSTILNAYINMNTPGYDSNAGFQNLLNALPYIGGLTRTDLALMQAAIFYGTPSNRIGIPNIVIVATDGNTNNGGQNYIAAKAAALKAIDDTTVYAIGIGNGVDLAELELIASSPDAVFEATFDGLNQLLDILLADVCAK